MPRGRTGHRVTEAHPEDLLHGQDRFLYPTARTSRAATTATAVPVGDTEPVDALCHEATPHLPAKLR